MQESAEVAFWTAEVGSHPGRLGWCGKDGRQGGRWI